MKAAIYARVSTKDKGQDVENQLVKLRAYALARDWEAREFIDHETGKHSQRAAFQELLKAASRREFGFVLVWALDRFTREGVAETFAHIKILLDYGVQFESLTEPHFRTTGPAGELMIAIAAWIAKQERLRISERTKAGLEVARHKGVRLGRPSKVFDRARAAQMKKDGYSWSAIARKLKIGSSTIRMALKASKGVCKKPPSKSPSKLKQTKPRS